MQHVLDRELAPGAYKSPMVSKLHSDETFLLVVFPFPSQDTSLPYFPTLACLRSALFCPNPNASSHPQCSPLHTNTTLHLFSPRATYQKCRRRVA